MSRYIIDTDKHMSPFDGIVMTTLGCLEDADRALEDAYQRGLEDGKRTAVGAAELREKLEYQRGLNDAWEAAKKIALMDTETSENVTGYFGLFRIMDNLTASEAIEKLKAYEEKQRADDEIKVGDEVAFHHDDRPDTVVVVTYIGQDGFIDGMDGRGTQYAHKNPAKWTKTGRHFDIDKILKEMSDHD